MNTVGVTDSLAHVVAVLQRWWLLIVIGTVLALSLGAFASAGSGTHYVADTRAVVVQPAQLLAEGNEGSTQRLADLMSTIALLGTSDAVLDQARAKVAPDLTIDEMRDRVQVSVVRESLVLVIRSDFPKRDQAMEAGAAVATALAGRLGSFVNSADSPSTLLTLEPVSAPTVREVAPTVGRTLLVALILGLGLSALAAFALDRS